MGDATPPPGWYDDHANPGGKRWWDGRGWTSHSHPPPPAMVPPPPRPQSATAHHRTTQLSTEAEPGYVESPQEHIVERRSWKRKWVLVLVGIALILSVGVVLSEPESPDLRATDVEAGDDDATAGTAELDGLLGRPTGDVPTTAESTVASSRRSTASVATTSTSTSSTSTSRASSPPTVGALVESSSTTGLRTTTTVTTTSSSTTAPPTTAPPSTSAQTTIGTTTGCDPNYAGACVPIASDVDCAGGSGNGPAYVQGPVQVIGTDIYGLDHDGDGVGCE